MDNRKMYGQGRRHGAGRSNKISNAGSPMEWKPKKKIETNESVGSCSTVEKHDDTSSVIGECYSVEVSGFSPKLVNDVASGMQNLNLMKNSCSKADNESKSVSTSDHSSKDSSTFSSTDARILSEVESSEKEKQIRDVSREKGESCKKLDDAPDQSLTVKPFDICPKKGDFVKIKTSLLERNREIRNQRKRLLEGPNIIMLRPGMVLMKGYISLEEQISIVKTCRELGIGEGGFYQPGYRDGAKLHLKMMCLGKNWDPQSSEYSDVRPVDNSKPPGIPFKFHDKVKKAIQDSNAHIQKTIPKGELIPNMLPDICIVNFYTSSGKLGLHQDKDESTASLNRGLPVVSFSIGESAEFLYGDVRDIEEAENVILESGDVLIFGGKSRHIFHGVTCIRPNTAPSWLLEDTDMCPGRLNLTFRQF